MTVQPANKPESTAGRRARSPAQPAPIDRASGARRADPRVALLWVAAALLVAAVIGVAVYKTWPVLFPQIAERAPLEPDCDITATDCTVRFGSGGTVWLAVRPRGIPTAHPLDIEVRLADIPAPERVELDFAGLDMDMGYNRVTLSPSPGALGVYTGTAMLPVCLPERMTWEARVLLYVPNGTLAAPFRFDTARRGGAAVTEATAD
jgi:hypothetical protein